MSTSCGIFWDIQNVAIPRQKLITPERIYKQIEEQIISKYDLCRKDFYVVGEGTVTDESIRALTNLGAKFDECGPGRNAADQLIIRRMHQFIQNYGKNVALIVLTGDKDFAVPLAEQSANGAKIFVIHKEKCANSRIDKIADYVFLLNKDLLELEKSPRFFINISCPDHLPTKLLAEIVNDLSSYHGLYAVHTDDGAVWCLFEDINKANKAACDLKGTYKYSSESFELITRIVASPPIQVLNLIKCAELSNPSGLAEYRTGKFNMPNYKPGMFAPENIESTLDNIQSIINTFSGNPTRQQPSNRSSNTGSNNEECILS